MLAHLAPLASDPAAARRLGVAAALSRADGGIETSHWVRAFEQRLDVGSVTGRLYVVSGTPVGFVSWSESGPLGVAVELLYVAPTPRGVDEYAALLSALEAITGPPAFVPGPLAGVPVEAEERLMRERGYRRYGRSEMVRPARSPLPPSIPAAGETIRPVDRSDLPLLGELHRRAYGDRFDRYLFLELADQDADALREVRQILDGRWGEFAPHGSWLVERDGRPVGAVLVVHGNGGALIADVMVDPDLQGRGIGRRVLLAALRAMDAAGEPRVYLNVTEGNERAQRLYRSVGFTRSLGPTRDWYNSVRIPVAPWADA